MTGAALPIATTQPFVFSADGHFVEPGDLLSEGPTPSLRGSGLRAEVRDDVILSLTGGDRACIMSRSVTGAKAMLWGAEYPRHDETSPGSKEIIAGLFDGIEIDPADGVAIVGANAARQFRLNRPEIANG